MNPLLFAGGILVLAATAGDFAYTTISANRTGPLTRHVAGGLWTLLAQFARLPAGRLVLRLAGPVVMSGVAMVWVVLTSAGWLLIFRADPGALVIEATGEPAGWAQSFAFVGSALSTLGASKAVPSSALWDNLSMVTAINGMVVLTLSVTFVLNVTQTVAGGRGFAALLRVRDPAEPENDDLLLPALCDLCVRLNASPLALYYSALRTERSLPENLRWLAHRMADHPGRFDRYREALMELPYLEADGQGGQDRFLEAMDRWTRRFTTGVACREPHRSPAGRGDTGTGRGLSR